MTSTASSTSVRHMRLRQALLDAREVMDRAKRRVKLLSETAAGVPLDRRRFERREVALNEFGLAVSRYMRLLRVVARLPRVIA